MLKKLRKIEDVYGEVFDENGEVKLCGRYKCMELISLMNGLSGNRDDKYFGDIETGFMNIENIKKALGEV